MDFIDFHRAPHPRNLGRKEAAALCFLRVECVFLLHPSGAHAQRIDRAGGGAGERVGMEFVAFPRDRGAQMHNA